MSEFVPFPKIKRLTLGVTVTEKIDGTNAAVHVNDDGTFHAQSRNRIITPDDDNFGFATWVHAHADEIVPARQFYTVADDGLLSPWHGVVWCNPPYSDPLPWCAKWAQHEPGGCLLIRADLSTRGPFAAWRAADAAWVANRRLQFDSGSGQRTGAVNFSTILLGRGDVAVAGMRRLEAKCGGAARRLAA